MISYRKLLVYLLGITLGAAFYDGIFISTPIRNFTISFLLANILVLFWIIYKSRDKKFNMSIKQKKYIKYFILLIFLLIFSVIFVNKRINDILLLLSPISLLFLVVISFDIIRSEHDLKTLFKLFFGLAIISFATLLIGNVFFGYTEVRAFGILSSDGPNYAANRILPVLLFFISYLIIIQFNIKILTISFISLAALLATGSAAAVVAFLLSVSILLLIYSKNTKTIIIGSIIILSIVSILIYDGRIIDRLQGGIAQLQGQEVHLEHVASIQTRVELDEISLDLIKRNPLIGIGFGNWREVVISEYYASRTSHNSFLLAWSELGSIIFIIYIIFTLFLLKVPVNNDISKCFKIGIIGCLIHMLALGSFLPKILIIMYIFFLSANKYVEE